MDAWTEEQEQQQGVCASHKAGDSSEERVLRREQKQRPTTYWCLPVCSHTLSISFSPPLPALENVSVYAFFLTAAMRITIPSM